MEIQGLGKVTRDAQFNWYHSAPLPVAVLAGKICQLIVEGYDEDPHKDDFHIAIANFLALDPSVLKEAEDFLFSYYEDFKDYWEAEDEKFMEIESARYVWRHIELGTEPTFTRRARGDKGIYVSLECNCDWEKEHGLQIVFKNGLKITKVGPFDGHLTNSDAYADNCLEEIVYVPCG